MRLVSFRPLLRTAHRLRQGVASALVAATILAGPAATSAAEPPAAPGKSTARSIDFYYAALAAAPDEASAARARGRLEAHWNASGSATADLLAARAGTAVHAGDRALALDLMDAVIVVAPDWAGARHRRAVVHLAGGDTARATEDLLRTLAMEPRHIAAMTTLAGLYELTGRKAEALKWLRRLATIDPRNPGLGGRIERLTIDVEGREL